MEDPSKERIPLSDLQKAGKSDWIDYIAPVGLLCAGIFLACCGSVIPMFGDYGGPPQGLAESNRERYDKAMLLALPGIFVFIYGCVRLVKAIRKR